MFDLASLHGISNVLQSLFLSWPLTSLLGMVCRVLSFHSNLGSPFSLGFLEQAGHFSNFWAIAVNMVELFYLGKQFLTVAQPFGI